MRALVELMGVVLGHVELPPAARMGERLTFDLQKASDFSLPRLTAALDTFVSSAPYDEAAPDGVGFWLVTSKGRRLARVTTIGDKHQPFADDAYVLTAIFFEAG
jgi:hypothetical protein